MNYYFSKVIDKDFQGAVEHTIAALKTRGFGIVTEIELLNHMLLANHVHQSDETIESIIDVNVPVVRPNTPLETLMAIFSHHNAVVIAVGDQVQGILTKIDILDFLSSQMK